VDEKQGALCTSWCIECAFLYEKYIHPKSSERLTSMVSGSSVIGGINYSSRQELGKLLPWCDTLRFSPPDIIRRLNRLSAKYSSPCSPQFHAAVSLLGL